MTTQQTDRIVNGVDVDRLFDTIGEIRKDTELARSRFRLKNRWLVGGHNRSEIGDFHCAKQTQVRSKPFVLDADEPEILLGEDRGANPVEYLLHALAACVTTSMVYHAASRGIEIRSVESTVEGDLDLRGFLGIAPDVRKGYEGIRVIFRVESDAPAEKLEQLARFSPVFDSVSQAVPVTVTVHKSA